MYTWLSSDTATGWELQAQTAYGGEKWTPVTFVVKNTSGVLSGGNTWMALNRIGNFAKDTTTAEERIGFDYNSNPVGLKEPESNAKFARVREVTFDIQACVPQSTSIDQIPMQFALKVWRSDYAEPTWDEGPANDFYDPLQYPGVYFWTAQVPGGDGGAGTKYRFKRFKFYVPHFFNDVEYADDNPTGNVTGTSSEMTNFWVAKHTSGTFTDEPPLVIYAKLYARLPMEPLSTTTTGYYVCCRLSQLVEYHRGDGDIPAPATRT